MTEAVGSVAPPGRTKNLLALCRVSNVPTVWMNVLAAVVLSQADVLSPATLLLVLSLSAFYCGGMCLNDVCDRESDAVDQPFRPIPSGRVSVGEARGVAAALFGLALAPLLFTPWPGAAVLAGLLLLAAIFAYDWLHKAHAWTVLLMAACRSLVFLVSAAAVAGSVAPAVWAAAGVQLAYTFALTAVARHENTRGERYGFPVIPWMIAGMCLVDGVVLAILATPLWLLPALALCALTRFFQRHVRGD